MVQVVSTVFHLASASTDALALALVSSFVLAHVAKSCWRIRDEDSNDESSNDEADGQ